ncbi:MAG: hypothetical protein IJH64_13120 [Oscillospiraceae bacterium]|nr:hypothetical protein [Oscillospiraceae bacterium]MBR0450936.1 hypothetical protein [Oscillospiraceae bacterium]
MCDPVSSCKLKIRSLIDDALKVLELLDTAEYSVEYSAISEYGEFSSNVSFAYANLSGIHFTQLAEQIAAKINADPAVFDSVTAVNPGYINFSMSPRWIKKALSEVIDDGDRFGYKCQMTSGQAVIMTVGESLTALNSPELFRNEAVVQALTSILRADGFEANRVMLDPASSPCSTKTIICAPALCWDSGRIPSQLSDISEHVAVADLSGNTPSKWTDEFVILLNKRKPQLPVILNDDKPAQVLYDYAWICSQLRSFDNCSSLIENRQLPFPESQTERMLADIILSFPSVVSKASADLDPSAVLRYLSNLTEDYRTVRDELGMDLGLIASRSDKLFWYCYLVRQVLHNGISLFRIEPNEYL